jgi:hypothetical protein
MAERTGYLAWPKSGDRPSDLFLDGRLFEARLTVPPMNVKLSDPLSGITKYASFSFTLDNNDGRFDGVRAREFFNAPARISRTGKADPEYEDFIPVRTGLAENVTADSQKIEITCADPYRALDGPVCGALNLQDYPLPESFGEKTGTDADGNPVRNPPRHKDGLEGKALPVLFGLCRVPLIELMEPLYEKDEGYLLDGAGAGSKADDTVTLKGKYLAGEGARWVAGNTVYGVKDGADVPVPCSFDAETGVITVERTEAAYTLTGADESGNPVYAAREKTPKPAWAEVYGYPGNRIGEIVTALAGRNKGPGYTEEYWDLEETDAYTGESPRINFYVSGGDVRKAIAEALKNDMAFLIQKSRGKFSLRRWGGEYGEPDGTPRRIESWLLTKQPQRSFTAAQERWFSSCVIKYGYNWHTKEHRGLYRYTGREEEAAARYLKRAEKTFETCLESAEDAEKLAGRLGARFCGLKETVTAETGADVSEFSLLDRLEMEIAVNGRALSRGGSWIVIEADPAQDRLVLEEAEDGV